MTQARVGPGAGRAGSGSSRGKPGSRHFNRAGNLAHSRRFTRWGGPRRSVASLQSSTKKARREASGLVVLRIFLPWSGERQRRHGFMPEVLLPVYFASGAWAGGGGASRGGLSPPGSSAPPMGRALTRHREAGFPTWHVRSRILYTAAPRSCPDIFRFTFRFNLWVSLSSCRLIVPLDAALGVLRQEMSTKISSPRSSTGYFLTPIASFMVVFPVVTL